MERPTTTDEQWPRIVDGLVWVDARPSRVSGSTEQFIWLSAGFSIQPGGAALEPEVADQVVERLVLLRHRQDPAAAWRLVDRLAKALAGTATEERP